MHRRTWQKFETRIAARFGGKRRGADTGNGPRQGKTDVIAAGWAIECKVNSSPTYGLMREAITQAETNAENASDIPVAIVKRTGDQDKDALVIMRLTTFMDHFGPALPAEDQPLTYAHRSE